MGYLIKLPEQGARIKNLLHLAYKVPFGIDKLHLDLIGPIPRLMIQVTYAAIGDNQSI